MKGHRGKVNAVTFSPDGQNLASCDQQRDIYIWALKDWSVVTKVRQKGAFISCFNLVVFFYFFHRLGDLFILLPSLALLGTPTVTTLPLEDSTRISLFGS